jgi:hypothetical protein
MGRRFTVHFAVVVVCASLVPAAGARGAAGGLVGWWQFEEGSGMTAADSSGNGRDGVLETAGLWEPGPEGQGIALGFGTGRCARVNCGIFDPTEGTGTFTLTLWCRWEGTPSIQHYLTKSNGWGAATAMFQIEVKGGSTDPARVDRMHLAYQGAPQAVLHVVPKNEWAHMALVFDGTHATGYLNGVDEAGPQPTGIGPNVDAPVLIGASHTAEGRTFQGFLDEVRIYSRSLTAAEIKDIFQTSATPRLKTWAPEPADGARAVVLPLLKWKSPGNVVLHNVYVGTDPNLTEADLVGPRQPLKMFFYVPPLQPGVTYYWRVDGIEADAVTVHPGDVWSFQAQPRTAYDPIPADGSNTVSLEPDLKWSAGQPPVQKHHLYFADNPAAVRDGAAGADKGERTGTSFAPGKLEPLTTYYWRVDEIGAAGAVQTGKVWSFTTLQYVDDMESYNDDLDAKTTIFDTWIDGLTNGLSGSVVGNATAPFAEQTIVHGGKQSMPLDYNNLKAPFYSEAERTFVPVQDWTANGVDTLVLYVRAKAGSKAAPAYVQLMDASSKTGMVTAEASSVSAAKWMEWKIPLSEFAAAGVNLARIKTMVIGVGDKANPAVGGTGVLYIDDIGLAQPAPVVP